VIQTLIEQSNILLIALAGSLIYIIQYYKDKVKFKRDLQEQIEKAETEIDLIELKKAAERQEVLKDKLLQYKLNRNVLFDGVKVNHILKELRELVHAQSVSIAIYHNGVTKGFKNFSFRFQEFSSVRHSSIYKYQVMPLSPYYEELAKYEKQDYVFYKKGEVNPVIIEEVLDRYNLSKLVSFPILVEYAEDHNIFNGVLSIQRNRVRYMLVGSLLFSLDSTSKLLNDNVKLANTIKEKLQEIMEIYKENNSIFS